MTDLDAIITKLQVWAGNDFHADRQLADEILIADDWHCEASEIFEGGVRWWRKSGAATYSTGENHRPHPLLYINDAFALLPPNKPWSLRSDHGGITCTIDLGTSLIFERETHLAMGSSREITIAICLAAMIARKLLAEHQRLQAL